MTLRSTQISDLVPPIEPPAMFPANQNFDTYQLATVLFVDMIGFTAFCANNHPAKVIEVLREFLALLSEQVIAHGGSVEKYLGDGLMAVFDGSDVRAEHATCAVKCAVAMQRAISNWNGKAVSIRGDSIQIAVGVHSGRVIVAAVGGESRTELAVLGDSVNVASRVEGKCRCLDASILVTSQVIDQVSVEGHPRVTAGFKNFGFQELRGRAGYVHLFGVSRSIEPQLVT